jgi:hypothetical protein
MELDDLFDPKVMVAVALTAAISSPPVRKAVRRGAVYGVAGAMIAADRINSLAHSVAENARSAAQSTRQAAADMVNDRDGNEQQSAEAGNGQPAAAG